MPFMGFPGMGLPGPSNSHQQQMAAAAAAFDPKNAAAMNSSNSLFDKFYDEIIQI